MKMRVKLTIPPDQLRKCTSVAELATGMMDHVHDAKDGGGGLYQYRDGVYMPNGNDSVWRAVQQLLELGSNADKWSTHKCNEVTAYITTKAPRLWEVLPPGAINVANGIMEVGTGQLRLHDPT